LKNDNQGLLTNRNRGCSLGCDDGFDNDYDVNRVLYFANDGTVEWDEVEDSVNHYDSVFIHTLHKLNDDDEFGC